MRAFLHLLFSLYLAVLVSGKLFGAKVGVPELSANGFKDQVLYNGNVTAVLFYAPWCGYCQKLAPEWKNAAKALKGIARVVAVDCDADINKGLCAKYKVQGYPTIKVFQPAKLTDIDLKDYVAAGKPLPKRRPLLFTYNGPRESKPITEFVVNHLRNYVATLDTDESLKWMAPNKVPRVIMLPGKKYKARQVSPLFKVLSREYFGKMRFAVIPRKIDGSWNLLGMDAQDDSQLIYMSDDKTPVVYKGSMKKSAIKRFLDEQYSLEMQRRKHKGESISRDAVAKGLEYVVEDQQTEEFEHVKEEREKRQEELKLASSVQAAAFSKYGKEMPTNLFNFETSTQAAATPVARATEDVEEAEEYEFGGEAAHNEGTSIPEDDDSAEQEEELEDVSLDSPLIDLKPDQIVHEGPEAVSSLLAQKQAEFAELKSKLDQDSSRTIEQAAPGPKPTPKKGSAGIYNYDAFVMRCLRTGLNCAVVTTTNKTRDDDLVALLRSIDGLSKKLKEKTVIDFIVVDNADDSTRNFLEAIGISSHPSLIWWDGGRQKGCIFRNGWSSRQIVSFLTAAFDHKVNLDMNIPPEYLYWLAKEEVEYLAKKHSARVKDEL